MVVQRRDRPSCCCCLVDHHHHHCRRHHLVSMTRFRVRSSQWLLELGPPPPVSVEDGCGSMGSFYQKRYRRINCTLDQEDSPGSGIDECVTGEPEFRMMSSWMCQCGGRDHHNPVQLSTNDLRLPRPKCKNNGVLCGEKKGVYRGLACWCWLWWLWVCRARSGDGGGGGGGRRRRCLARPSASENGGGGCLTCHVRRDSGWLLGGDQIWEGLGRDSEN